MKKKNIGKKYVFVFSPILNYDSQSQFSSCDRSFICAPVAVVLSQGERGRRVRGGGGGGGDGDGGGGGTGSADDGSDDGGGGDDDDDDRGGGRVRGGGSDGGGGDGGLGSWNFYSFRY